MMSVAPVGARWHPPGQLAEAGPSPGSAPYDWARQTAEYRHNWDPSKVAEALITSKDGPSQDGRGGVRGRNDEDAESGDFR